MTIFGKKLRITKVYNYSDPIILFIRISPNNIIQQKIKQKIYVLRVAIYDSKRTGKKA